MLRSDELVSKQFVPNNTISHLLPLVITGSTHQFYINKP